MKINPEIVDILTQNEIYAENGLAYLVCRYFSIHPDYIPKDIIDKVNALGIIKGQGINQTWTIDLFIIPGVDPKWDWVEKEYIALFAKIGKGTHKRESLTRMKKLFSQNPDIRKEEILGATELYLFNTESKFARQPHYFLEKGVGSAKTQDILDWIEKYRQSEVHNSIRDNSRRLQ